MLKRPTQNATETASPVKVSSAAFAADSPHARVRSDQLPLPKKLGTSPSPPQSIWRYALAAIDRSDLLTAMAMKQTSRASAIESSDGSAAWKSEGNIPIREARLGICARGARWSLSLRAHHQSTNPLFIELRSPQLSSDTPFEDRVDSIRKRKHLVEVKRNEQNAGSSLPREEQALVDRPDRRNVQTSSGLDDDEQPRRQVQLAGENDLLLIAAGEQTDPGLRIRRAHVEFLE